MPREGIETDGLEAGERLTKRMTKALATGLTNAQKHKQEAPMDDVIDTEHVDAESARATAFESPDHVPQVSRKGSKKPDPRQGNG